MPGVLQVISVLEEYPLTRDALEVGLFKNKIHLFTAVIAVVMILLCRTTVVNAGKECVHVKIIC